MDSWFRRLKITGKRRSKSENSTKLADGNSYAPSTATDSCRRRSVHRSNPTVVSSTGCGCREAFFPSSSSSMTRKSDYRQAELREWLLPEFTDDTALATESSDGIVSWVSTSCSTTESTDRHDNLTHIDLPRIMINADKSKHRHEGSFPVFENRVRRKTVQQNNNQVDGAGAVHRRRRSWHSTGVRLRLRSPRVAGSKERGRKSMSSSSDSTGKSLSDSFAVVKSSEDPRRDFRESMLEMIMENKIWESKDLEELLACYLSLNSDEYHHLIINEFKKIWVDIANQ